VANYTIELREVRDLLTEIRDLLKAQQVHNPYAVSANQKSPPPTRCPDCGIEIPLGYAHICSGPGTLLSGNRL
jgi:hypothetical protein